MKNIHILPTDKPSRLYCYKSIELYLHPTIVNANFSNLHYKNYNIYITSDEEIKKGDWYLDTSVFKENITIGSGIYQMKYSKWGIEGQGDCKKIILTTDQALINDGVQAIDDEFLEWFVKNPSCEFAHLGFKSIIGDSETKTTYKITIPKEEPKQETLEEAVYKFYPEDEQWTDRYVFKLGAKWQAERMYSEEEVRHLMTLAFEQGFKKADIVEAGLEAKETDIEVNWIFLKNKKW